MPLHCPETDRQPTSSEIQLILQIDPDAQSGRPQVESRDSEFIPSSIVSFDSPSAMTSVAGSGGEYNVSPKISVGEKKARKAAKAAARRRKRQLRATARAAQKATKDASPPVSEFHQNFWTEDCFGRDHDPKEKGRMARALGKLPRSISQRINIEGHVAQRQDQRTINKVEKFQGKAIRGVLDVAHSSDSDDFSDKRKLSKVQRRRERQRARSAGMNGFKQQESIKRNDDGDTGKIRNAKQMWFQRKADPEQRKRELRVRNAKKKSGRKRR